MKKYLITSNVVPVESDFWIDANIVPDFCTTAESVEDALKVWFDQVESKAALSISKTARKKREPIYIDTPTGAVQVGYILVASTEVDFNYKWKRRRVHIWATINEIINPFK